jgi:hypothetical protein
MPVARVRQLRSADAGDNETESTNARQPGPTLLGVIFWRSVNTFVPTVSGAASTTTRSRVSAATVYP